jgi:hypothetical protein
VWGKEGRGEGQRKEGIQEKVSARAEMGLSGRGKRREEGKAFTVTAEATTSISRVCSLAISAEKGSRRSLNEASFSVTQYWEQSCNVTLQLEV